MRPYKGGLHLLHSKERIWQDRHIPLAFEYCCPGFILNKCAFAKPNNNIYWILPYNWALNFTFSNLCWWDTGFWIGTLLA